MKMKSLFKILMINGKLETSKQKIQNKIGDLYSILMIKRKIIKKKMKNNKLKRI